MHLSICSVIRDERDILPAFIGHHVGLVDRIVVVDHRSTDGTRDALRAIPGRLAGARIELLRYDQRAYQQSPISAALAAREFKSGADWVIMLDVDEFLDVAVRDDLEQTIGSTGSEVVQFHWVNLMPTDPPSHDTDRDMFDPDQEFVTLDADHPPTYGKVAMHRSFWQQHPRFVFHLGNHFVHTRPGAPRVVAPTVGRILHVPARSAGQVLRKRRNQIAAKQRLRARHVDRSAHVRQYQEARRVHAAPSRTHVVALLETVVLHSEQQLRDVPRTEWSTRPVRFAPSTTRRRIMNELACAVPATSPQAVPPLRLRARPEHAVSDLRQHVRWRAWIVGRRVIVMTGPRGWAILAASRVLSVGLRLYDLVRRLAASLVARYGRRARRGRA